jgi:hypothetical protein
VAKNVQLKYAILIYLALFWCATAYATEISLEQGLRSLSAFTMFAILTLSALGGAGATLVRMTSVTAPIVRNLPLEIARDVVCSILAGFLGFLLSSWYKWEVWYPTAIIITVSGFGGSKVLEIYLDEGLIPFGKKWLRRLLGVKEEGTTP